MLQRIFLMTAVTIAAVSAQPPFPPPGPPPTPKAMSPIDLTGYWVSIVTEDWRWRMVTPARGDYTSVPLNPEGRRVADTWDPAKEPAESCKAYGAAAIMRVPTRLHITWVDDKTMRIDTDAGTQTRTLHFGSQPSADTKPELQGYSAATWDIARPPGLLIFGLPADALAASTARLPSDPGAKPPPPPPPPPLMPGIGGSLRVVTSHLRPGYLRKNGVPYSANAVVTEYFDVTKESNGDQWLIVKTKVVDPQYLATPFITSSHFKRQPDAGKWNPSACAEK
jgi:hypothetical protein